MAKVADAEASLKEVAQSIWPSITDLDKIEFERICRLWDDRGVILRMRSRDQGSVVAKVIWNVQSSGLADERKLKSYENEGIFYEKVSGDVQKGIALPRFVHLKVTPKLLVLVQEDISDQFPRSIDILSNCAAGLALQWLARFHAHFWNRSPSCLAPKGTYWHLETRPDELEALFDNKRWKKLAQTAGHIDSLLNGRSACTLLHGDFKSANLQWNSNEQSCVAYDFQYSGRGAPMKDVVNLLVGSVSRNCDWDGLLECYFTELETHVQGRGMDLGWFDRTAMKQMYELALCDLVRFRLGWRYGMYGEDQDRVLRLVQEVLDSLEESDLAAGLAERYFKLV